MTLEAAQERDEDAKVVVKSYKQTSSFIARVRGAECEHWNARHALGNNGLIAGVASSYCNGGCRLSCAAQCQWNGLKAKGMLEAYLRSCAAAVGLHSVSITANANAPIRSTVRCNPVYGRRHGDLLIVTYVDSTMDWSSRFGASLVPNIQAGFARAVAELPAEYATVKGSIQRSLVTKPARLRTPKSVNDLTPGGATMHLSRCLNVPARTVRVCAAVN